MLWCPQVVRNVEKVIAIELLAACQAIEFLRPLKTTQPLEEVIKVVRSVAAPWDKVSSTSHTSIPQDRYMSPDITAAAKLLKEGKVGDQRAVHRVPDLAGGAPPHGELPQQPDRGDPRVLPLHLHLRRPAAAPWVATQKEGDHS